MPFIARPAGRGLLATAVRTAVIAGTANVVTSRIAARQRARAAQPAQPVATAATTSVAPQSVVLDPTTESLRQLGQLHDDGVLSYSEFTAAKQRLLGLSDSPTSPSPHEERIS